MKIGVVGSRNFADYEFLKDVMSNFKPTLIVSGGAFGADELAFKYATENNIKTLIIKPDWKQFGRAAGPLRNNEIIENSDFMICFWDDKSKGTYDVIKKCEKLNKQHIIFHYNQK